MIGQRFERLIVLEETQAKWYKSGSKKQYLCECDCGKRVIVLGSCLRRKHTKSCGCLRRDTIIRLSTVHNHAQKNYQSKTYQVWLNMIARCENEKLPSYKNYGGRNIKVCKRWRESFENFLVDMGEKPKGLTIERENNNGNYEPGNCKWATYKEQANNRRFHKRNVWIEYKGRRMILAHWAKEIGITPEGLSDRLKHRTIQEALES